jgi:hypothetical protein
MKLESSPMGESISGMSQILSQLTSLSLQVEDMKKDKGKDKREDIWCVRCISEGMTRNTTLYSMNTWLLEP